MPEPLDIHDWGRVPYREALRRQRAAAEARARHERADAIYFVEHEPVLTIGRGGHAESLRAGEAELRRRGIEVVEVERGGDVTYHGPGQLVGYPVVALPDLPGGRDLHRYLRDLEEALIRALSEFGVRGGRRPPFTGVWVDDRKVAAIGVAVRQWISFHGFALNVDPDLSHFRLIHPCGIRHLGVTSMRALLGAAPPRGAVIDAVG
ncbi:MAG TPA: lipoyl(octanoyl) transferase LipB, partial [Candidatus Eisenbacteria bacterium]